MSQPRGAGEEVCNYGSKVGLLIRLGSAQGLHSFNLASGSFLWFLRLPNHDLSVEWRTLHQAIQFSSVQFSSVTQSCLILRPHELQHARPPCLSPAPGVYSNSCPLSRWCHPTISSSVIPFSSCLQSFPASGSFQMCQVFISGGQSIGVSALASVLPMNIQDWFPLGWTGWISLQSKGLSRVFSNTTIQKHQFFSTLLSKESPTLTSTHDTGKTIALTRRTFLDKVMSLLFNVLSRLVITFLPRSKHLLISWLQSSCAAILEPKKLVCYCFHCFPICLPWSDRTRNHDLSFLNVEL